MDDIDIDIAREAVGLPPMMTAAIKPQVAHDEALLAAGTFRFTVNELRRWAEGRLRRKKGSGERAGEFLPEIHIGGDKEKARTTALKRAVTKKAAPAKRTTKTAATKRTAAPPPVDEATRVGSFKDITTIERARKAAAAEASKAETQHRNAQKAAQAIRDNLAAAQRNPDAEPHLKAAARAAAAVIDTHIAAADKAFQEALQAQAKADATTDVADAIQHGKEATAAIARTAVASQAAQAAAREVLTAAKAKPRLPFDRDGRSAFDAVPPDYRKATKAEERSLLGNSTVFSGMWLARDPNSTRPQVKFKPDGWMKYLYSAAHHLKAERLKWARIERLRPVAPAIKESLERMAKGEGVTGTELQKQRFRDNAFSLLLTMHTGMRPSDPGTQSEITDTNGVKKKIDTYGSSTLQKRHVESVNRRADGSLSSVYLKFPGKSGVTNRIKVTDPYLMEEIVRRRDAISGPTRDKAGKAVPEARRELSPVAKSGYMNTVLKETASQVMQALGMDEHVAQNFGSLNDEDTDGGADPMAEATGDFTNRTLRSLWANSVAPEVFAQLVQRGGPPQTAAEFEAYIQEAAEIASARLGNKKDTFLKNYLSAIPFQRWMPSGVKPDGTPEWEDWWAHGKKKNTNPE